jgi:hypothetical protein
LAPSGNPDGECRRPESNRYCITTTGF